MSNTQAHANRMARVSSRLRPQLLGQRIARARDRLRSVSGAKVQALSRSSHRFRARFERVSGRLQPGGLAIRISRGHERLDALSRRAARAFCNAIVMGRRRLEGQQKLLAALGHQGVLERGFAIVRDAEGGMVRSVASVRSNERLEVEVADGRFATIVDGEVSGGGAGDGTAGAKSGETADASRLSRARTGTVRQRIKGRDRDQGSLF